MASQEGGSTGAGNTRIFPVGSYVQPGDLTSIEYQKIGEYAGSQARRVYDDISVRGGNELMGLPRIHAVLFSIVYFQDHLISADDVIQSFFKLENTPISSIGNYEVLQELGGLVSYIWRQKQSSNPSFVGSHLDFWFVNRRRDPVSGQIIPRQPNDIRLAKAF